MARKHTDTKKTRDTFYIITNGEKTEKNYFSILKSYKSIYDVKVLFNRADPRGLVEYARQYVNEANQVWCVFDVDSSQEEGRLVPAINLADKWRIKYAFSNRAFEVWLISHYKKCSKEMNCCDHKEELTRYLQSVAHIDYDKTCEEMLKKYFVPKYKTAITNAKIVYQQRMVEHVNKYGEFSRPRIWEWNSCTTVFKLVEALRLQK